MCIWRFIVTMKADFSQVLSKSYIFGLLRKLFVNKSLFLAHLFCAKFLITRELAVMNNNIY